MQYTQYLVFEAGRFCNLGHIHDRCPNKGHDRFRHLPKLRVTPDDTIVETAAQAYHEHGFRGSVVFNHYNEPMLVEDRLWRLMDRIDAAVGPLAHYAMWTNGTRFPKVPENLSRFSHIVLTDYAIPDQQVDINQWMKFTDKLEHRAGNLDTRLNAPLKQSANPCLHMFSEFILDYYGNTHLCCHDWQGLGTVGNINEEPFSVLLDRWQATRDSMMISMPETAPEVCRQCSARWGGIQMLVPHVALEANEYVRSVRVASYKKAKL